jgi:hypothetical protein
VAQDDGNQAYLLRSRQRAFRCRVIGARPMTTQPQMDARAYPRVKRMVREVRDSLFVSGIRRAVLRRRYLQLRNELVGEKCKPSALQTLRQRPCVTAIDHRVQGGLEGSTPLLGPRAVPLSNAAGRGCVRPLPNPGAFRVDPVYRRAGHQGPECTGDPHPRSGRMR